MGQTSKIVIIDYGSGNLQSVLNAIELIKNSVTEVLISGNPQDLKSATHIILPGVGAFGDCISGLRNIPEMIQILKDQVLNKKKPFLGICVGMQLLANKGFEYGEYEGLGFIPGRVIALDDKNNTLKIPHMGWNDLQIKASDSPILKDLKTGDHVYFVHSYYFVCDDEEDVLATVDYGQKITAIISKDNIIATQFHPEKSSEVGLKFLKNFIDQ